MRYLVHSSVAYISASAELWAVMVCRFDCQCIGPFSHMINPESDRVLKRSRGGAFFVGLDWSWGPQLASVNGVIDVVLTGNLTKALMVGFWLL